MQLSCNKNYELNKKNKNSKIILDLFEKKNGPISIIELVSIFKNDMNKTTVYRILTRLEESGILHSFVDKKGLKRYAKNPPGNKSIKDQSPHPHFLCEDCGISKCLPIKIQNPTIPDLIINSAEQLYLGQCGNCQA